MTVYVDGLYGLGDNIYQRAFVRVLAAQNAEVFIATPWPELYRDVANVRFVRPETPLRTQAKNVRRQPPQTWSPAPPDARRLRIFYGHRELTSGSVVEVMAACFGVPAAGVVLDLPDFGPAPVEAERPLALVRPVTARKEWLNRARNPRPEYVALAAERLMRTHHVVSVADVEAGAEWFEGEPPPAHVAFHAGELTVSDMLALVRHADIVVGGVGWIVPAAIAAGVRLFVVLGGQGAHNAPEKIATPEWLRSPSIGWARPDRYCMCWDMGHDCDKRISDFEHTLERFLAR